ncbi:MAG: hypothetical protein FWC62_01725, partial [Firmicutes bacterium]|nr:hypothetical protein [Bacillota bacterium]
AAKKPTAAAKKPTAAQRPTAAAKKPTATAKKSGGLNLGSLLSLVGGLFSGNKPKPSSAKPASESSSVLSSLLAAFTGGGGGGSGSGSESGLSALVEHVVPLLSSQGLLNVFKKNPSKALDQLGISNLAAEHAEPLIAAIQGQLGMAKPKT